MPFISVQVLDELEVYCPTCHANPDQVCVPTPNDQEYDAIFDTDSFHCAHIALCRAQFPIHGEP